MIGKSRKTGTKIRFVPDPEIFTAIEFSFDVLAQRLREQAFLNKGVRIQLRDERSDKAVEFAYAGGIASFVEHLSRNKNPLHARPIHFEEIKEDAAGGERCEIALQWNDGNAEQLYAFTNRSTTATAAPPRFLAALTRSTLRPVVGPGQPAVHALGRRRARLTAVVSARIHDPKFSQTKDKLALRISGAVQQVVNDLWHLFEENLAIASGSSRSASRWRGAAARKARELTRRRDSAPSQVADCTESATAVRRFLVEGDWRRHRQQARPKFQAIPPLRARSQREGALRQDASREEIRRSSPRSAPDRATPDVAKLRYHVDHHVRRRVDGAHIRTSSSPSSGRCSSSIAGTSTRAAAALQGRGGEAGRATCDDREYQAFLVERIRDAWELTRRRVYGTRLPPSSSGSRRFASSSPGW